MKHGKKYLESAKLIESSKLYDPDEAVKLALQTAKTKFDETMEISVRLGVDHSSRVLPVHLSSQYGNPC